MKVILLAICLFVLNTVILGQNATNKDDSLKKEFAVHFKILDRAAKKSKADTIYCCRGSATFMEYQTKIETGTMGNVFGRYGFTREALKQWHEWCNKKYGRKSKS